MPIKVNFDLHRAGGLWLWPILFVFAWSSVGMNLPQVYSPVMAVLSPSATTVTPHPTPPGYVPNWRTAYAQARHAAAIEGARRGFKVFSEHSLFWDPDSGTFTYAFTSSRDVTETGGWSGIAYRPTGEVVDVAINDGRLSNGGLNNWLMALHTAQVGGLAYRIFVSVLGLAIVVLSITGVVIWMRKRSARLLQSRRNTVALNH